MQAHARRKARVESKLRSLERASFEPITTPGDGELTGSKLSGTPWMPAGKTWPTCKGCRRRMVLVVQLDLRALPHAASKRAELMQLFACGDTECNEGYATPSPGGHGVVLRVVAVKGEGGVHPDAAEAAERHSTPARVITGWTPRTDVPRGQDAFDAGLELNAKERRVIDELSPPDYGIKLFGWPDWVQSAEWPACPTCDERMELLLQLVSERHIPVSFGDGLAYVMRCARHPRRLSVSWSYT